MDLQSLYLVVLIATTAALTALIAGYAWRWRSTPGGVEFALLMVAVTIYSGASAFELAANPIPVKIVWTKISYIGLVSIPPLWLLFAIGFSQHAHWLTPRRTAALWVVPVVILGLAATNEWHRLIWPTITLATSGPNARLIYAHGPGIWVLIAYSYPLLFIGALLLIQTAWHSSRLYRLQVGSLVTGALVPWAANLLYLTRLNPWPGLDLTPLGLLVTGLLVSTTISRFHTLDIVPVARDVVFNSIGDGVLVVDTQNRLVDMNPVARNWTGLGSEAIGRDLCDVLPLGEVVRQDGNVGPVQASFETGQGDGRRIFDMTISPLVDVRGLPQGRVVLLHDIGHERALLDAEHRRTRQMEVLNTITRTALSTPDYQQMIQVLADSLGELFGADAAFLTLWDEDEQRTVPAAVYGILPETYSSIQAEPGEQTITAAVLEAGRILQIPDLHATPYLSPRLADLSPIVSLLALPLIADGRKLGAVLIAFNRAHTFTAEEIALGEQASGQVAVSLAKTQLYETEREQRKLTEALRVMGMAMSESLNFEDVLDRLLDEIGKVVPYDAASVLLADEANQRAHIARQRGYDTLAPEINHKTNPLEYEIDKMENLSRMATSGRPLIISDIQADPDWSSVCTTAHLRSWAGAPIMLREQVIGFLSLDRAEPGFYHPEHADRLSAFTGQAAIAIDNARIFTEVQRGAEKERLLLDATRDFTAGLEAEAVLRAIGNHMVKGLGVDGCTVSRWDRASDCVITLLDISANPSHPIDEPGHTYPLSEYPVTRAVLEKRQPFFLYMDDPAIDPAERELMERFGNQSLLMLPLIVGRERQVFGLVELFRKDNSIPYNRGDLEMAQSFTAQAAVALENARLYAEKQHLAIVDELTGLYNRRGLFELGQREFDRATRFKHPLAALFLDIDHFKLFNDQYSYAVGDQVLHRFAACVRAHLREFDLIGRYGGEEFVVLLPEASLASAGEVAERVRCSVENLKLETFQGDTNITVSIGVCQKTPEITSLDALLDRVGQAVHQAKNLGRNRVTVV